MAGQKENLVCFTVNFAVTVVAFFLCWSFDRVPCDSLGCAVSNAVIVEIGARSVDEQNSRSMVVYVSLIGTLGL